MKGEYHYDWPSVGYYLQADPMGQSPMMSIERREGLYPYAANNPIAFRDPTGLFSEMCYRDVLLRPLALAGAKHCYVRRDGDRSLTTSYWADTKTDETPHVTSDLAPNAPATCAKIKDPSDPSGCKEKTDFDRCIDEKMKECEKMTYSLTTFNCCSCVERAISGCGGTLDGNWPKNLGYGPQSK